MIRRNKPGGAPGSPPEAISFRAGTIVDAVGGDGQRHVACHCFPAVPAAFLSNSYTDLEQWQIRRSLTVAVLTLRTTAVAVAAVPH